MPASFRAKLPPPQNSNERPAVVFARLIDLHDPRVLQPRQRFGFGLESPPSIGWQTRMQYLQCDNAVRSQLPGLVDNCHSTAT
jgi:hypothetical protein